MSRYTSFHIVCYQKCRYFFINKKKIGSKKKQFANPPANEKQEMVADEIFHTLLTNEKQDKI
jgi:hypothetical protein